jgi:hypothetical protein
MDKNKQPKKDSPTYKREPLKVSEDGKWFSVDGAQVVDLMADYKRWGLLDANGRVKGG